MPSRRPLPKIVGVRAAAMILVILLPAALSLGACDEVLMPRTKHPVKAPKASRAEGPDCLGDPCRAMTCPSGSTCVWIPDDCTGYCAFESSPAQLGR
ncbi:MAG TPA: hypothetical protein VHL80_14655 [Polyangia bacterium]|nr:hypothetical protein [Polyangia bacterium]